ncbi:glycosyltransferase family 4 protein [Flavivirga rizhaonensis]|uniref:Glycosyltransferase n=1 Tax=Flavivirga rizhaonensis TaxID=2559571 RepID=A0A4S1E021_9FLAO|nr:glycosyltransferase family 4 protein [Flavivirga rizhaonensis]TGV03840.1 glycosyltransferase [Flavivirga rizhaonensis]
MNDKILMVGPFEKPITGVSVCNDLILKKFKENKYNVTYINTSLDRFDENVGKISIKKLFYYLRLYFLFYKIFNNKVIYITPGHTFLGIIKYSSFILMGRLLKKKTILHIHSDILINSYNESNRVKKNIMKFVISKASRGIVLSESLIRNLTPFLPRKKIEVLFNFVENDFLLSKGEIISKKYDKIRIVYLSNLMTQKGIFYLLDAFKLMSKNGISYEAKLAGNIDKTIEEKVKLELKSVDVEYKGIVRGKEKRDLLKWGNIFVFPSFLSEGLPLSILENMACGNIIFTTKHPSLEDIKDETDLIYIDKKSSDDIYTKITKYFKDKEYLKNSALVNYQFIQSVGSEDVFFKKLLFFLKN